MYNQFFTIKPRISEKKRRKQSCTPNNLTIDIHSTDFESKNEIKGATKFQAANANHNLYDHNPSQLSDGMETEEGVGKGIKKWWT